MEPISKDSLALAYAKIFGRGFLIVFLTSTNMYQVPHGHNNGAAVVGVLISVVWWQNAGTSGRSNLPFACWAYGLGAGAGTMAGAVLASLFYGGA